MKKLLYHFDTDPIASVFDSVVAHDGGADHVTQLSGINEENCGGLVEGAIYTRAKKDKKNEEMKEMENKVKSSAGKLTS